MRRHDQPTAFGGILQERTTNPPSFHWVDASCGRQCGIEYLQRAVDRVAAEDSRHGALYPYTQLSRGVTRQRQQLKVPPQFVAIVNELHLPGLENRQDAVLKAGQLYCIATGLVVLLLPILELAPAHEIARVGKGRYPPTVVQARVPADMIDVKVGTEHDVHRLWRYARLRQAVEKAAPSAPMELRNERSFLFLAGAGVEQDRTSVRVEPKDWMARISRPRAVSRWSGSSKARADSIVPAAIPGRKPAIESSNQSISTTTSTALSPARNRITYDRARTRFRMGEAEKVIGEGGKDVADPPPVVFIRRKGIDSLSKISFAFGT